MANVPVTLGRWGVVLLGNAFGGVLLGTIVNYFQTPKDIQEEPSRRLELYEWLFT